jgi:hypothetical protein
MQMPQRSAGNVSEPLPPASWAIPSKEQGMHPASNEEEAPEGSAPSLFQDSFFLCNVRNIGDLPGAGNIFLEVVVDADTGVAFATVYSARTLLNPVDILTSRVLPYYERQAIPVKEIHTRRSSHYCGSFPAHPFETFLVTSHIEHGVLRHHSDPYFYLCEQFYWFVLKEFLQPELRRKFRMSMYGLQKNLDVFVGAYNAMMQRKRSHDSDTHASPLPAKFSVDL